MKKYFSLKLVLGLVILGTALTTFAANTASAVSNKTIKCTFTENAGGWKRDDSLNIVFKPTRNNNLEAAEGNYRTRNGTYAAIVVGTRNIMNPDGDVDCNYSLTLQAPTGTSATVTASCLSNRSAAALTLRSGINVGSSLYATCVGIGQDDVD